MKKIVSAFLALIMMISVIPTELVSFKVSAASSNSITGLTATPTDVNIKLSWDAVSDKQDKYYIRVYSPDGSYRTLNTDNTEITVGSLEYYTDYTFKVITKDSEGYMSWTDAMAVTSQMVIGERVVGLKAAPYGRGARITFEPVPNAEGYFAFVYKADTTERQTSIEIADPSATSVNVVNALNAGEKYIVKITPKLNGQYVAGVKENGLGVEFIAPVINPSSYTIVDRNATSVSFSWDAVAGISEYFIRVKEKETGNPVRTIHTTDKKTVATLSRYTDGTRLSPNTTYTLEFCAYHPNVKATYGEPVDITTGDWESVNLVAQHNKETNAVTLSWNSTTNSAGYYIYRIENGVSKYIKYIEGKDNTSFTTKLPTKSGDYRYSVIAYERSYSGTSYTPASYSETITVAPKLSFTPVDTEGMTDLQKALVITGESFVLRGNRAQYEDTRLVNTKAHDLWRWNSGYRSPEDYTSQSTGYSNCAAFTYDIYLNALDYNIGNDTTAELTARTADVVLTQTVSASWTEEEKAAKLQEFKDTLQPGDLMVYRYQDDGGHVMMYAGNGMMIHCTGAVYDWTNKAEKYETTGSFKYESYDCLFDPTHRRYLCGMRNYRIIRPLLSFTGEIPEKTLDRMEIMRGIMAEKTASHTYSQTAGLGNEITFTFTLENYSDTDKTLTITDTVPEYTNYISGAQTVDGDNLSWTVTVPAGETVKVSYKVSVQNKQSVLGKVIESQSYVEGISVNCPNIHIGNTLSKEYQDKISETVALFADSELTGLELADAIYLKAINASSLTGKTANEILDGIYQNFSTNLTSWPAHWQKLMTGGDYIKFIAPHLIGGRYVLANSLSGLAEKERTRLVKEENLIVGDIILYNTVKGYESSACKFDVAAYLYTGEKLLDLETNTLIDVEPRLEQLIGEYHFAVIRPSLTMSTGTITDYEPVDIEGMTDLQKALVITAESYVLRGNRAQYEDTRFSSTTARDLWRWNLGYNGSPESYTTQFVGYSNCAAFTYDVYYNALNYDIEDFTTADLTSRTTDIVLTKSVSSSWTDEQKEAKKQEFLAALQPGDLMVYRYTDGSGHVMMYVGNGMMIHCTGSNYDWTNKAEKYENTGSFKYESIDCLFDSAERRYLFDKKNYRIVRPLLSFTGEIPQKTLDRMADMRGITAEKLASHTYAQTVNPGEEITYTFSIKNFNESERTFTITDTVPANTTYISGAQNIDGTALSWTVTVPAKSTVTVSYTVKVNADAIGKKISSSSFIGSISLDCPDIHVANTLTKEEQKAISDAAATLGESELTGIELADAIYLEALGKSSLTGETAETLIDGVYQNFSTNLSSWPGRWQKLATSGNYIKMLAPHLYGGRQVLENGYNKETDRTRLVTKELLVAGDIIILNKTTASTEDKKNFAMDLICYLYTGDKLLDLSTNTLIDVDPVLDSVIAYCHFAVLRPSMVM